VLIKKKKRKTDDQDNNEQVELGETEGESPEIDLRYDKTISVQYKNKTNTVLNKYNYSKMINYYIIYMNIDLMLKRMLRISIKKNQFLNSDDIRVTTEDKMVFLVYTNPTEKGKSYKDLLDTIKKDPSVIKYHEQ
jgi:hypothetical protein